MLPDPYVVPMHVWGINVQVWHVLHHLQSYCYPIPEALVLDRDGYYNTFHGSRMNYYLECSV